MLHSAMPLPHRVRCAMQAVEGECQDNKLSRHVVTIDDYQDVPANDERALMKAVANQPVSVAIEADQVRLGPPPSLGAGAGLAG